MHRAVANLHVASLNIRNLADRWSERLPLLLADMSALQPDVLGLQECVYVMQQDRLIGAAGEGRYRAVRGWAGRPEYGNSLLIRESLVTEAGERLDLGHQRAIHCVPLALPGGRSVVVAVTHLHHLGSDDQIRDNQTEALLAWLEARLAEGSRPPDAVVVMGDFNADPGEPTYARMRAAGFRSAHAEANGAEPAVTWPSGLQAPMLDTEGSPECLDYIWVRGAVAVADCRLVFDRPGVDDPTVYPSDHFGLAARLTIG